MNIRSWIAVQGFLGLFLSSTIAHGWEPDVNHVIRLAATPDVCFAAATGAVVGEIVTSYERIDGGRMRSKKCPFPVEQNSSFDYELMKVLIHPHGPGSVRLMMRGPDSGRPLCLADPGIEEQEPRHHFCSDNVVPQYDIEKSFKAELDKSRPIAEREVWKIETLADGSIRFQSSVTSRRLTRVKDRTVLGLAAPDDGIDQRFQVEAVLPKERIRTPVAAPLAAGEYVAQLRSLRPGVQGPRCWATVDLEYTEHYNGPVHKSDPRVAHLSGVICPHAPVDTELLADLRGPDAALCAYALEELPRSSKIGRFVFQPNAEGFYSIQHREDERCMESRHDGTSVQFLDCVGNTFQQWQLKPEKEGGYTVISRAHAKPLKEFLQPYRSHYMSYPLTLVRTNGALHIEDVGATQRRVTFDFIQPPIEKAQQRVDAGKKTCGW